MTSESGLGPSAAGARRLRHARVEDRRGERDGALSRLVRIHRSPDRVLASRAHPVEEELMPIRELGLGVTPWSPLKGGALSGKYTRASAGGVKRDRGQFLEKSLNERTYALEKLDVIAKAHDSTVARVALAWVMAQPGVTSTIIGARRLAQLEDNLKSVDVTLTSEELGRLDACTKPPPEPAGHVFGLAQRQRHRERRARPAVHLRPG